VYVILKSDTPAIMNEEHTQGSSTETRTNLSQNETSYSDATERNAKCGGDDTQHSPPLSEYCSIPPLPLSSS
jgi:hypothetical protein